MLGVYLGPFRVEHHRDVGILGVLLPWPISAHLGPSRPISGILGVLLPWHSSLEVERIWRDLGLIWRDLGPGVGCLGPGVAAVAI